MGTAMNNLPPLPDGFQIGTAPNQTPPLPQGFVLQGQEPEEKSLWQKTKDMVQGQAEFPDAGSYEDWLYTQPYFGFNKFGANLKTTLAGMFGNDQDKVNSFNRNHFEHTVKKDKYGKEYFEDQGKKWYIDKPGVDVGDVADFAGEAGTYLAGGMAAAPIKNLAGRVAATGAIEGSINATNQKIAGRDKVDLGEVGLAAGGSALFQALTPVISKAWRGLKGLKVSDEQAGQQIAQQLGLRLDAEQTKQLGNYAKNLDNSIDRRAIASHVELNQTPTRGTLTSSQSILDTEDMLRHSGTSSTKKQLNRIDSQNEKGLSQALQNFQSQLSGGSRQSVDAIDAGGKLQQSLINAERNAKNSVNQAYDNVGNANVGTNTLQELPQRIKASLAKNNVILDPDNVKKTNIAFKDLQKSLTQIQGAKGVPFKAIEQQRRRMNGLFKSAKPEDRRALTIMMKEYDNTVQEAFEKELLSGDASTLQNLQSARKEAANYFNKFNGKGSIVQKWLDTDTSPEQIVNGIINMNGVATVKAPSNARKYLSIVGKDTPEHNLMKEMIVQRISTNHSGVKTKQMLRTSLQKSLNGQPTLMNEVFNKKELGFLSRTLHFLENTTLKGANAKSSGTMERLARWAGQSVGDDVSLSNIFNLLKKSVGMVTGTSNRRYTGLPTQQIDSSAVSGLGAYSGESLNQ